MVIVDPRASTRYTLSAVLVTHASIPSLVPRPCIRREKWPGIHCLRMRERFRKFSANKSEYGQVTHGYAKLDIRLAVWQLCLRGKCFSLSVVSIL